mgnify:CR=1 FL=1
MSNVSQSLEANKNYIMSSNISTTSEKKYSVNITLNPQIDNLERINRGEYSSSVKDVVELESNKYAAIIEKDNSEEKETSLLILDQDNIIEINNTLNRYTNY